jgi:hypothetical protein
VHKAVFATRVLANYTLSDNTTSSLTAPSTRPTKDARLWTIRVGVGVRLGLPAMFALGMASGLPHAIH